MIEISTPFPTIPAHRVSTYRPECSRSACEQSACKYSTQLSSQWNLGQSRKMWPALQARARASEVILCDRIAVAQHSPSSSSNSKITPSAYHISVPLEPFSLISLPSAPWAKFPFPRLDRYHCHHTPHRQAQTLAPLAPPTQHGSVCWQCGPLQAFESWPPSALKSALRLGPPA